MAFCKNNKFTFFKINFQKINYRFKVCKFTVPTKSCFKTGQIIGAIYCVGKNIQNLFKNYYYAIKIQRTENGIISLINS